IQVKYNGSTNLYNTTNTTTNLVLDNNGSLTKADFIPMLCGNILFTINTRLTDKAGNLGNWSTNSSISSLDCLVCASSSPGTSFILPVKNIAPNEEFGSYKNGGGVHYGMDFASTDGTPIYATSSGTIVESLFGVTTQAYGNTTAPMNYGAGNLVTIQHSSGIFSTYFHLQNSIVVTKGTAVTQGQLIGYMGTTGNSTGSHLHFQIEDSSRAGYSFGAMRKASAINPRIFLGTISGNVNSLSSEEMLACSGKDHRGGVVDSATDNWLFNNQSISTITAKFKLDWLGNPKLESLQGATPLITRLTKETDYYLGNKDKINDNITTIANLYNLHGIAPSTQTNLKIEIFDKDGNFLSNNNSYTSPLQEASYRWRKNSFTAWDNEMDGEISNSNTGGRLSFKAWTKQSAALNMTQDNITMQDEIWIDSFIKHNIPNCYNGKVCTIASGISGNDKYGIPENGRVEYRKTLEKNTERLVDRGVGIERRVDISGENSSEQNLLAKDSKNRAVKFINMNSTKDMSKYDGISPVWILSHGWNGGIGDMQAIAESMKNNPDYKQVDNYILALDWREISNLGGTVADLKLPTTVCNAATWTRPTAIKLKEQLNQWGLTDRTKINLIGHSLGTILNNEIGIQFGKVNKTISLDTASSPCDSDMYKVQEGSWGANLVWESNLDAGADYSLSINGSMSFCTSQRRHSTANIAISTRFNKQHLYPINSDEHGWVPQMYKYLNSTDRFEKDELSITDGNHSDWRKTANYQTFDILNKDVKRNNNGMIFTQEKYALSGSPFKSGEVNWMEVGKYNSKLDKIEPFSIIKK
ncbi:MAG: peptidoglycan DD-metalloendopeptidase family protein, partial [Candidatus Parcubacteria bacterium]|nr:peptidoglycan DD-metalloendopeptidase family protein [Candidatus Paceibacterota bacterium]